MMLEFRHSGLDYYLNHHFESGCTRFLLKVLLVLSDACYTARKCLTSLHNTIRTKLELRSTLSTVEVAAIIAALHSVHKCA
eukprot:6198697-Pleurochrysis_carterae.AAC.1